MPLITVLLPVYNAELFLRDAVDSILRQTFTDFELLIVDDGSTDRSAQIIDSFSDARIHFVRNEQRLKLSGALNRGMEVATGKYIARMDADDICLPSRLEEQFRFMEAHPEIGMCGSWVETIGEHPSSGVVFRFPADANEIKAALLFDNPFAHPTVIFRKELFDKYKLRFDGNYYPAEDRELWVRALEYFPAANIKRVLLKYRLHPCSMTMSGKTDMDAQAHRILTAGFSRLGLAPSIEDVQFHQYISTDRIAPEWSQSSVERAERWLLKLLEANNVSHGFNSPAFEKQLQRVWFSVCYRSLGYGLPVLSKYLFSRLNAGATKNRLIMLLAFAKRKLSS